MAETGYFPHGSFTTILSYAIGVGIVDSHLIYFRDIAALTWAGKEIPNTRSETLELYIGPSIMSFHIPFSIGMHCFTSEELCANFII